MHLRLRHLEVFDAVMEAGSVSRAAQRLNLSQPAVSVALSSLEAELGFRLFHRARGYFAPTREAQLFHGEAERGLMTMARIAERAAEIRAGSAGHIAIASNGASAINLLPAVIAEYQRAHPRVTVDLKVRSSRMVAAWADSGQIDLGLLDAPVTIPGPRPEVFSLPCVCILREDDPLAAMAEIRPEMLAGRPVVGITGDHGIDRALERLASERGLEIPRPVTAYYFAIARNLVREGAGLALIDPINGRMPLSDGVTWRPFRPRIDFELAMIAPPEPRAGVAVSRFVALLRARIEAALAPARSPLSQAGG
ncbi:LysR family transcriptional regulator [Paralimibaculum aggregatum]|uniref:LysR family transcriptional regulator n=1 Tax=Paralimibaculum aggregatum TaxID=3036245 RepID=A0ABQ6LG80_9RHOB|nr:LysR substrate-binding domain-containing protein [Limibaculum sp. NKW23]GMG82002.1 LysR family transcriptional regulator [Limibaculum sp. NKW23]